MSFTLRVQNYRGLRKVEWSPEGVCALVGPNASGKTTLLDVPQLLGDANSRGFARALEEHGGLDAVRTFAVAEEEPLLLELAVGNMRWQVVPKNLGRAGVAAEEHMFRAGEALKLSFEDKLTLGISGRSAWEVAQERFPELRPIAAVLASYRLYANYDLTELRRSGSQDSTERRLGRRGANVFSVLRNWRDRRDDAKLRYEFVLAGLRELFPDYFDDLEFSKAGQVVGAELRLRPYDELLPASLAPDGWFVALLHLTAIASADEGGAIAIDEPENALHPRAIKLLLELMRGWSKRRGVTVLLATHSPVIIDAFRECPDKLYVMEPGRDVLPVALSDLHERDWLAHFALGDLYTHEEFGAPPRDDDDRADHHRPV
jgi:predicted ATPase